MAGRLEITEAGPLLRFPNEALESEYTRQYARSFLTAEVLGGVLYGVGLTVSTLRLLELPFLALTHSLWVLSMISCLAPPLIAIWRRGYYTRRRTSIIIVCRLVRLIEVLVNSLRWHPRKYTVDAFLSHLIGTSPATSLAFNTFGLPLSVRSHLVVHSVSLLLVSAQTVVYCPHVKWASHGRDATASIHSALDIPMNKLITMLFDLQVAEVCPYDPCCALIFFANILFGFCLPTLIIYVIELNSRSTFATSRGLQMQIYEYNTSEVVTMLFVALPWAAPIIVVLWAFTGYISYYCSSWDAYILSMSSHMM